MDLFNVVDVSCAKDIIDKNFNINRQCEEVDILNSTGRSLSEDIVSKENVPNFRKSTVDGYAINSKDANGASETIPGIFDLKGEIVMGEEFKGNIEFPGECMYIPTGGMMPKDADSVVMIEYTEKLDDETIIVKKPTYYGENVVQIGEDIKTCEVVLKKGLKIRSNDVGVLTSLGYKKVKVVKKPKVGIISTGDEIIDPKEKPKLAQVRDINTYLLYTSIIEDGGEPLNYGVIKDEEMLIKDTIKKALKECDMVLISGGSSVGKKDQVIKIINSLKDSKVLVHGIAIKPGKPTIIAKVGKKAVFGLPGHPLSCEVVYKSIVVHYIDKWLGHKKEEAFIYGTFEIDYHKAKGREEYLPVTVKETENNIFCRPIFSKSSLITGFSKAYGYVKIDKNEEGIRKNQKVKIYKL